MSDPIQHFYGDNARAEMHPHIPISSGALLDVGCHQGAFGHAIKQLGMGQVWGVEANPQTAAIASSRLDKVLVGYFDAVDLPDAFFEVITFNDVLEHISDPASTLRAAARKLKPGGVVVASIPNLRNFDNLIHILYEKDFRYEEFGIRDQTHLRFFTKKSIPRLFEQAGYAITSMQGINENWWKPTLSRRLVFRLFPRYLADTRHLQFAIVAKPMPQIPSQASVYQAE